MEQTIRLHCLACGTRVTLLPGAKAGGLARECLVCPVCRAVGAALDEALAAVAPSVRPTGAAGSDKEPGVPPAQRGAPPTGKPDRVASGSFNEATRRGAVAPVTLGRSDEHRLLACVRPDGPELEGASREEKELARMLWRLAGE